MASPPRWANRFLEWYCNPGLLEEIQGDVFELFQLRLSKEGKTMARLKFIWDVARFFRWGNIRRTQKNHSNLPDMFKSYFKLGFRNALRNKLTSTINLIGLSVALGVAIAIFTFIDYQFNMDSFHKNKNRIYQITNVVMETGGSHMESNWGDSPLLLGPALKQDNPAVEAYTRVEYGSGAIRYNDAVFNESIWFVDPDFMSMFTFNVLYGDPMALSHKNGIIISKKMSEKYFGNRNPVGETYSIKFTNGAKEEFVVGAVLEALPGNSSIRFDNLLSMEAFRDLRLEGTDDWGYLTDATFIMLKKGHDVNEVSSNMEKYKAIQNAASVDFPIQEFKFYLLDGLSHNSYNIYSAISMGSHPAGMITLGIISFLLLLLACFNYMNVAVATVTTRLKEIGIRKVVGGRKKEIAMQFLIENLVLCLASLVIGTLLAMFFLMPGLNSLFPIHVSFGYASSKNLIMFFAAILFFVGMVSGVYPALYISSFQPVQILRGREKFGGKSLFSKSLLTIQFMLAFVTIIGSFVFIANSINLRDKDWGYDHDQTIVVPVLNNANYLALRDKAAQNKNIISYAGASGHIGATWQHTSISFLDNKMQAMLYPVGFGYLQTMNIRLKEGRFFDESVQSDNQESVIVTSLFAKEMNWENPIGQYFEYDSIKRYVIGVVEDFHYDNFYGRIDPVVFLIAPKEDYKFFVAKARPGTLAQTEQFLQASWKSVAPDDPYEGYFQDSVFDNFYNDNNGNIKVLVFISGVAVLLACIGLFGLVSYNITRRMKEFSIRKVFGAKVSHIFKLMNRDYVWILFVAFAIGSPAGFLLVDNLIRTIYPEPTPATATPFLIGIGIMLITVALTVGSQINRIIKNNPVHTLRSE
ncbi:MAG: ABC transporter permease [Cyclobacteriaceae bacterium]|nr:ABC transporter permease [Cyclobacteriaceae bacterium]MCB0499544.1 ABC transporter permease [Cyclobacteriaceae bacterium]MCB9238124.1 ABC transporter permease [Flammeovirgaceae bacterium]MCW5901552.1 ABC transporter permease [Cyclobacteriaceae bacterium]